jgi:hypothetical protein
MALPLPVAVDSAFRLLLLLLKVIGEQDRDESRPKGVVVKAEDDVVMTATMRVTRSHPPHRRVLCGGMDSCCCCIMKEVAYVYTRHTAVTERRRYGIRSVQQQA